MEVFISLVALTMTLLFIWLKYLQTYWRRRGIPHDEPNFPQGNLRGWRETKNFIDILDPVYKKYKGTGPFVGFYFFLRPCVFAVDLDFIKNVLNKDFNKFDERGVFHNEPDDPLSGNLFNLDGQKWRSLRQKLSQTFTSGKMKYMYPTVMEIAERFNDVFGKKVDATEGGVLEITGLVGRFTADVIGSCAFGLDCNSLYNPEAEFVVMGKKAIVERNHNKFIDVLIEAFPDIARKLRMRQIHPEIQKFYGRIVKETIEYRKKNNVQRNDFMNMLIELKNEQGQIRSANGKTLPGLTLNEIIAQCFIFFVAGFDTSSSTMGFALFEIAKYDKIQEKLRDEINRVLKEHNNLLTYECLQDMRYLDQVISETLRKYPILPVLMRKAIQRYETHNPKYYVEKGTQVIIPVNAIHYDPDIYPDPERFDPDRFTVEEIQKRPACSWLPFGDGPRNCIGLRFGRMQAAVGLAMLIKNFKFSPCEKTPKKLDFMKHSILLNAGEIRLKIEKI